MHRGNRDCFHLLFYPGDFFIAGFICTLRHRRGAREGRGTFALLSSPTTDSDNLENRQNRLVYVGDGAISASENPISQSKNRFLAIFACVAQRRGQKLERTAGGAESCRFSGFAKDETATAHIENLSRGTRGEIIKPVVKNVKL